MIQVSVVPRGDGWAVCSDHLPEDLTFTSGAKAENTARQLGERLARQGRAAEIRIHVRGGALAGRFIITPGGALAVWPRSHVAAAP